VSNPALAMNLRFSRRRVEERVRAVESMCARLPVQGAVRLGTSSRVGVVSQKPE
jgi:hypothetical protein